MDATEAFVLDGSVTMVSSTPRLKPGACDCTRHKAIVP